MEFDKVKAWKNPAYRKQLEAQGVELSESPAGLTPAPEAALDEVGGIGIPLPPYTVMCRVPAGKSLSYKNGYYSDCRSSARQSGPLGTVSGSIKCTKRCNPTYA